MPPRNERGQFTRNDGLNIPLPTFVGLYKIFFIGILVFPWYVIIKNRDFSSSLFSELLGGTKYCPKCPICPILPPPKCPIPPPCPILRCPIMRCPPYYHLE